MPEITISFKPAELDFIFAVLTQQPLPYATTAPLIASISKQVQAAQASVAPAAVE